MPADTSLGATPDAPDFLIARDGCGQCALTLVRTSLTFLSLICASCSDPTCLAGEVKRGNVCVRYEDGGVEGDDGAGELESDPPMCACPPGRADDAGRAFEDGGLSTDASPLQPSTTDAAADASSAGGSAAVCGNGTVEEGERCDGNCPTQCPQDNEFCTKEVLLGTGCDRVCTSVQVTEKASDGCCVPGETYADERYCLCGNGLFDPPEECDDFNSVAGDGCSPDCKLEDRSDTLGDDRRGISCGDKSCPAGHQCIVQQEDITPYTCKFRGASGGPDYRWAMCDGPEDCFPSELCLSLYYDPNSFKQHIVRCTSRAEFRDFARTAWNIHCHVDEDCPHGEKCISDVYFVNYGVCSGQP